MTVGVVARATDAVPNPLGIFSDVGSDDVSAELEEEAWLGAEVR